MRLLFTWIQAVRSIVKAGSHSRSGVDDGGSSADGTIFTVIFHSKCQMDVQ